MRWQIFDALDARWLGSLAASTTAERAELVGWFPHLRTTLDDHQLGSASEDHRPHIAIDHDSGVDVPVWSRDTGAAARR